MIAKVSVHKKRLQELGLLDQGADMLQKDAPLSERERKYCRCLVKAKSATNPYAVCTKSVGRKGTIRCFQHYNLARFDEEQLNALTKLHKKSSPDETVRVWLNENARVKESPPKKPIADDIPGLLINLQPYLLNWSDISVCNANLQNLLRQALGKSRSDLRRLFAGSDIWDVAKFSIDDSTLQISVTLVKKDKSRFNSTDIEEAKATHENRSDILKPITFCSDRASPRCCAQLDVDLTAINRI